MRGAFGLVSLLVCAAIIAYVWSMHTAVVSRSGTQATEQATQISGRDANGENALKSITAQGATDAGGHLKGLLVTDVIPGGAMDKTYGFHKGDKITREGDYDVDLSDDADTASAMLLRAFQGSQSVVVVRDGQQVTLPLPSTPGGPASQAKSLQDQINQIQKAPEP